MKITFKIASIRIEIGSTNVLYVQPVQLNHCSKMENPSIAATTATLPGRSQTHASAGPIARLAPKLTRRPSLLRPTSKQSTYFDEMQGRYEYRKRTVLEVRRVRNGRSNVADREVRTQLQLKLGYGERISIHLPAQR